MITLQNMIFANPIAYQIFPNMVNTYNTSTTTEYAVYSGYLNLYKDNKLVKQFTGTSTIDLSDVSGRIRFDNVTDTYSAVVGEWDLAKSQDQIMEDNIRQAMVLWYDIAKQGATNESMAENPVLRDLSGNGHDATCYNFAWAEESGISTTNYPHALVSDGVDDYAMVEGLPNIHSLFIKHSMLEQASTDWRYLYNTEISGAEDRDRWYCATNPGSGVLVSVPPISDDGYAQKVNDIVTNNRFFEIFNYRGGGKGAFALYSLILFNRTLTPEEIEWVKTNLIETEQ